MLAEADASIMVKKCQKMVSAIANRALPSGMSEIVSELEGGQEIAEDRAKCEREERIQFQMIQRGDFIKAGWWHWRAGARMKLGRWPTVTCRLIRLGGLLRRRLLRKINYDGSSACLDTSSLIQVSKRKLPGSLQRHRDG